MESVTQEKIKAKRSLDTWIESNNNEQLKLLKSLQQISSLGGTKRKNKSRKNKKR